MPCFHPLKATHDAVAGTVSFQGNGLYNLRLACNQCIGCRLERSRQWAVRCLNEASLHDKNCFVTLTYDAAPPTLIYWHFQDFLKRLRKSVGSFSYYMAGEYGSKNGRPHFHALLFGVDFDDKYIVRGGENPLYRSPLLESKWKKGFSSIGAVTFESAAYVARYCTAKITGPMADDHYRLLQPYVCPDTGEIYTHRKAEFNRMSLRNPVGRDWLRLYWSDVRDGSIIVNGKPQLLPRFYRRYFKNSSYGNAIKLKADLDGRAKLMDNTISRLAVKESITKQRFSNLTRSI